MYQIIQCETLNMEWLWKDLIIPLLSMEDKDVK